MSAASNKKIETENAVNILQKLNVRFLQCGELYFATIAIAQHVAATVPEFADRARSIESEIERAGEVLDALETKPTPTGDIADMIRSLAVAIHAFDESMVTPLANLESLQMEVLGLNENEAAPLTPEKLCAIEDRMAALYRVGKEASADITLRLEKIKEDYPDLFKERGKNLKPETALAVDYELHAGPEWRALQYIASDGKSLSPDVFKGNEQRGSLRHHRADTDYFVELTLTEDEIAAGYGVDLLRDATRQLTIDAVFIWYYVSRILSPPRPLPDDTAAIKWIDLDDVARKALGGVAPNPAEKLKRRAEAYHAIKYGARGSVGGERRGTYFDDEKQPINTKIRITPWTINADEKSEALCLLPEWDVPLRVRLVASPEWTALTTHPKTAQFLPMGEVIGAIAGNQPGGAWARALGLSYMTWCRINQASALKGVSPCRRALLDTITPKKKPYKELAGTPHANRIREYWAGAESLLTEAGLIVAPQRREITVKGSGAWLEGWLKASAGWKPGEVLRKALEDSNKNHHIAKPANLKALPKKARANRLK